MITTLSAPCKVMWPILILTSFTACRYTYADRPRI
jgi:hypothetical protein